MPATEGPAGHPGAGLKDLIADLSRPEAYPHPVDGVQVAQTHISAVFLTGRFAYKVKKPVNFGFLDYTRREARLHFCREELRLNRRLAPSVYLEVVPVVREGGRLRIGAAADADRAEDWAVKMVQLPEARMLPRLLAEGQVTEADIAETAHRIVRFHGQAASGPEVAAFGEMDVIRRNVKQALPEVPIAPELLPPAQRAAIEAYQERFEREREPLFRARREGGRIREGHGDLRTQNLCFHDGVQIFDCIEFTDRFRFLDAASDLAYLAMDLDLSGRADLRRVLVDACETESGDRGLAEVLPFYLCFRACVRGKIAHLASLEPEIPAAERETHAAVAAAAFDLAWSYAHPPARPVLWVTVAYSGSGKSRLARELARRLPAVHLASDRVRKELAGVAATERLSEAAYAPAQVTGVYAELRRRADAWLRQGESVILDATFLDAGERERAAALAEELGAEVRFLRCDCPDAVIRERLERRRAEGRDPSDAGIRVYEQQRRDTPLPEGAPPEGWAAVDTGRDAGVLPRELVISR